MAKKRKKEEQEVEQKYEFVPPDFDEKGFLENDIKGTKALMISSIIGIIAGIIAYFLTGVSIYLGFIIVVVCAVALRYIYPFFKIDFAKLEKKTIAGNYVLLFLLALGIWIILLNAPFSDHQDPEILPPTATTPRIVFQHNGEWKAYESAGSTPITAGDLTNITVHVRDNNRIATVQIEVHASGTSPGAFVDMQSTTTYGQYEHTTTYSTIGGSVTQYLYTIEVTDGAGRMVSTSGTFSVVP